MSIFASVWIAQPAILKAPNRVKLGLYCAAVAQTFGFHESWFQLKPPLPAGM
jgi:hypothetical protein